MAIGHLVVKNSFFSYKRENYEYKKQGIDFRNIACRDINIDIDNAHVVEDTLYAKVNHLETKEQSGFIIRSLATNAVIAPNHMKFFQLHAVTKESDITDYYSMEYHSIHDFDDYENRVTMTGHFIGATVSIGDIDYFAHALQPIDHNITKLSGDVRGTVNNLKGKGLTLEFGRHSIYHGDISFKDLTQPDNTFISADVKSIRTTAEDVEKVYPYLNYPASMKKLGIIWFTGKFDGFYKDFVADGEMRSELGRVKSDINFKIIDEKAHYSGNFSTTDFDVGRWVGQDSVGRVTMQVAVKGSGLKISNLDADGVGVINSIAVKGYDYKDIKFDGTFKKSQFDGFFAVKDDNLDLDFHGAINLAKEPPVFQFRSTVNKANLQALHLTKLKYTVATNLRLDLIGDKLDDIAGGFYANKTRIHRDDSLFVMDSLAFTARQDGDKRTMKLNCDYADATVTGNYNFRDLPNALQSLFSHYFEPATRGVQPAQDTIKQDFRFNANIYNTRNFTKLFLRDLKNIEKGTVSGYFNNQGNVFDVNVNVPGFTYRNMRMKDFKVASGAKNDKISLVSTIDTVFLKDSLLTSTVRFNAGVEKDTMLFQFAVEDTSAPNRFELNGKLASDFKTVSLNILPSKLVVNGDEWKIKDGNSIFLDDKNLVVHDLQMVKGSHFFKVNTFNPDGRSHLNVEFEDIKIDEVIPGLKTLSGFNIEGTANGYFTVLDVMTAPSLTSMLDIQNLKVNNDNLGNLQMLGTLQPADSLVHFNGNFRGIDNNIGISGTYNIDNADNYLDANFDINKLALGHIEKFVSEYVSKIKGEVSGKLRMKGSFARPDFTGSLTGHNVQTTVNYLNTAYSFDDETVDFASGEIDLGTILLKDAKGNSAVASGNIMHDHLKNFLFNVDVRTDNFMFLNTSTKNNATFYGPVYAKGLLQISGPLNDINIYASATTMKGTDFAIAVNNAKDVDRYNFYRFIKSDSTINLKMVPFKIQTGGVNLNFELDVTPDAKLKLIMSSTDGDMITTRGHGNMNVVYDKTGDFTLQGRYEIDEGQYTFNLQNVVSKNFEIARGSEILWTGDPYDPRMSITAVYKLRAAPYDLIEDVLKEDAPKTQSKNRIPVFLQLKLAGSLLAPDINFDINIPDADQAIRTEVDSKLALIRLDQNELNKQVVGLLVLNRFLPVVPIGTSQNANIANGATNTVSEFVANQLSIYLTDWISKFITEVQLDIKYHNYQNTVTGTGTSTASQDNFDNRRELQLALTKSFFNDRVEVDVGGNFDFGQNTTTTNGTGTGGTTTNPTGTATTNNNVTGDFEIRYNITADGRIKVKVFRKGEYDIFQERNLNKTGVGITYKREFDSVKDLVQQRKDHKKKKEEEKERKKQLKDNAPAEPKKDEAPVSLLPHTTGR